MTPTWLLRRGGSPSPGTGSDADSASAPVGSGSGGESELSGVVPVGSGSGGESEPGAAGPAETASGSGPEPAAGAPGDVPAPRPPAGRLRRAALTGTAAALVLAGCGFFYGAHQLRSAAPARNHALTDTEATSRVAGDIGNALARVFSYTPDGTAAAERSARTVLDGRAARQYETLFARVRDDLTEQRVTLSTRAVRTGVVELDGDKARLLVFLDQTSRRGKDEATTAAAQLSVTARLEGDRWRIVDIKAR
jgi:Mce-associated membrane protein